MRRALPVSAVVLLILALFSFSPARAATGTFYFHGKLSDQADKQAALSDDTARSSATF